jgi:hypothetical protein
MNAHENRAGAMNALTAPPAGAAATTKDQEAP